MSNLFKRIIIEADCDNFNCLPLQVQDTIEQFDIKKEGDRTEALVVHYGTWVHFWIIYYKGKALRRSKCLN